MVINKLKYPLLIASLFAMKQNNIYAKHIAPLYDIEKTFTALDKERIDVTTTNDVKYRLIHSNYD